MQVTAFVDVLSHWCLAAQPAFDALHSALDDDLRFEFVLAPFGDIPYTTEQEAWFYARGTFAYGARLDASWCEGTGTSSWHANAAVAAGVSFGANAVELGHCLSRAALVDGHKLGREEEAARIAAGMIGIDEDVMLERMRGEAVAESLRAGNARLAAAGCGERPSWVLANDNGDRAVLQGVWQAEAVLPLARALLADERAYGRAGAPPA